MTNFPVFLDTPGFNLQTRIRLQSLVDKIRDQLEDKYVFRVIETQNPKVRALYWACIKMKTGEWMMVNHYYGALFIGIADDYTFSKEFIPWVLNVGEPIGYIDIDDPEKIISHIEKKS